MMLRWDEDKFLVLFFTIDEGPLETFKLDQVQYLEGKYGHIHNNHSDSAGKLSSTGKKIPGQEL